MEMRTNSRKRVWPGFRLKAEVALLGWLAIIAATGLAQQKRAADLFKQAQVYEREQKYVAAESVYQEVLASDPDNPEALPPLCSEPQRLPTLQVAHYGYERLLFPRVDLVHPHLRQRRLPSGHRPPLQIAKIAGPHRARRRLETSRHLPRGGALAGFLHRFLEALRERRLARQLQQ